MMIKYPIHKVAKDFKKAFDLIKQAAVSYDEAQYELAQRYINAEGTPRNYGNAVKYLTQAAHQGILFENDLAVPACINLQRVALADTHGSADFLGNDHAPEIVLMCQVKHKIFGALHRCFLLDFCATFMRVPRLPLAHSKYGNPSHTPQRHRRYHRGR